MNAITKEIVSVHLDEVLAIYSSLKIQIIESQEKIAKLEKQDLLNTKTIEKYYNKKKEYKQKIENMETESLRLLQQIDFLETELKDYKDTLKKNKELKQENEDLKVNLEQTKERTIEMFDANNVLLKNFNELQKENEMLRQQIVLDSKHLCKEFDELKKENDSLKTKLLELEDVMDGTIKF